MNYVKAKLHHEPCPSVCLFLTDMDNICKHEWQYKSQSFPLFLFITFAICFRLASEALVHLKGILQKEIYDLTQDFLSKLALNIVHIFWSVSVTEYNKSASGRAGFDMVLLGAFDLKKWGIINQPDCSRFLLNFYSASLKIR